MFRTTCAADVPPHDHGGDTAGDLIPPFSWRNLHYTWNDNASFRWI